MNRTWMKVLLPIAVLAIGTGTMFAIIATEKEAGEKEEVDTRPIVNTLRLQAEDHQVVITSFAEVQPMESTRLAAQVSGEVISWNPNFVPGELIKHDEVMFTIEKDAYQAAVLQAEAALTSAQATLIEEHARAKVAANEAARMPDKKVTDLYLRKPQVMSAEANVKSAKAALQLALRDLNNCDIRAPYDALVVSKNLGLGQFVRAGATVAELHNIEVAEITFPIAGFDSAYLPKQIGGVKAEIKTTGPNTTKRIGVISRDLGIVDNATRMSHLVVRINDPYSINSSEAPLKFGSYVEITFPGITLPQVFRLPQSLITNRVVWLVDDDNKLQSRRIDILREEDEYFYVHDGLSEQDRVVTTPPDYPQNGMEVVIAKPESKVAQQ